MCVCFIQIIHFAVSNSARISLSLFSFYFRKGKKFNFCDNNLHSFLFSSWDGTIIALTLDCLYSSHFCFIWKCYAIHPTFFLIMHLSLPMFNFQLLEEDSLIWGTTGPEWTHRWASGNMPILSDLWVEQNYVYLYMRAFVWGIGSINFTRFSTWSMSQKYVQNDQCIQT